MSIIRQRLLVDKLIEKTGEDAIEWKSTFDDDIFQASFTKNSIRISRADGQNGDDYNIHLLNSEGKIVDYFSDIDLDRDYIASNKSYFLKLRELFTSARRKALGSDEVLSDLLEEIEDLIPF